MLSGIFFDNEGIGRRGYRVGNPLRIAWANDFFRPIQGTYGVMELQPGQVNWGSINPQPLPGAVRLWMWSVFAGGSDFICTYRYRQPLYGTEQYHYGIVGTDGVTVTPGGREYEQLMKEIRSLRKDYRPKEDKPETFWASTSPAPSSPFRPDATSQSCWKRQLSITARRRWAITPPRNCSSVWD